MNWQGLHCLKIPPFLGHFTMSSNNLNEKPACLTILLATVFAPFMKTLGCKIHNSRTFCVHICPSCSSLFNCSDKCVSVLPVWPELIWFQFNAGFVFPALFHDRTSLRDVHTLEITSPVQPGDNNHLTRSQDKQFSETIVLVFWLLTINLLQLCPSSTRARVTRDSLNGQADTDHAWARHYLQFGFCIFAHAWRLVCPLLWKKKKKQQEKNLLCSPRPTCSFVHLNFVPIILWLLKTS